MVGVEWGWINLELNLRWEGGEGASHWWVRGVSRFIGTLPYRRRWPFLELDEGPMGC